MNKILIVGHPQSDYQEVESLLNECGMSRALPSRRDGFRAEEIGATLCKAHKTQPLHLLGTDQSINQLEISPVWHGMALDLMLGNVEQELWGWSDPSSVYLLDYWKTLDQKIAFILVYDSPESLLGNAAQNDLTEEELQRRAHTWTSYNAALLHFYYRNHERCLLVHARQVRLSADKYLQEVRARISTPLAYREEALALPDNSAELHSPTDDHSPTSLIKSAGSELLAEDDEICVTALPSDEAALEQYLAQALISQHSQVMQLYAELQSAANLPLADEATAAIHALQAWRGLQGMHTLTRQLADQAEQQENELHRTRRELESHRQEIQRIAEESQVKAEQIEKHLAAQRELTVASQEQKQENELVLLQLHQVQEELERFYLESQQQQEKLKALQEQESLATEQAQQLEHLRNEKEDLTRKVQEAQKLTAAPATANEDIKQENELLLLHLHQVQEELERYYLENQRLRKNGGKAESKNSSPAHYGAAERVKSQLSYRLGTVMMKNYRTLPGLVSMPWALLRETREFRRARASGEKLPPLRQYRDAHEGQRVKQHLTYRLGFALVTHSNSPLGWIKLPFALRREIKAFRQQRKAA